MRHLLATAILTGVFCAVFALVVRAVAGMFGAAEVAGISFASGFTGSLVAQTIMRGAFRRGGRNQ